MIELSPVLNTPTDSSKKNKGTSARQYQLITIKLFALNLSVDTGSLWGLVSGLNLHGMKYQRVKCQLQEYFKSPCQWAGNRHMNFGKDKSKEKPLSRSRFAPTMRRKNKWPINHFLQTSAQQTLAGGVRNLPHGTAFGINPRCTKVTLSGNFCSRRLCVPAAFPDDSFFGLCRIPRTDCVNETYTGCL